MVQNNMQIKSQVQTRAIWPNVNTLSICSVVSEHDFFYIVLETFGKIFKPILNWKEMSSTVQA